MHESFQLHHDRFRADLGIPRFHRAGAKDQTDLLDLSGFCAHTTGVQYQRELCLAENEKLYEWQSLTLRHQDSGQGVPRYEKLSRSGIREYQQPAPLNLQGSLPEVHLATGY